MYSKEEIWGSFAHEIYIIKHLAEKIPAGALDYRPTEKQRSMLELLQYISRMGVGVLDTALNENPNAFGGYVEASEKVTLENFAQAMDEQEQKMKELYEQFDDAQLNKVISMWGATQKKSLFILNLVKMFAAYKTQLFLYIKASGVSTIGTSNLWAGMDMPQA
jgi:hypothetical protein